MATMSRVKNTATAHDISKVIRANMTSIDCRRISNPCLDEVSESYEEFLCELVRLTTRPNAKVVAQGATLAFGGSDQEAAFFGQRIHAAVTYCRTKGKGSTSGAKLNRSVRKIWSYIKACNREESSGSSASDSVKKMFKGPKGKELKERALKFMMKSPGLEDDEVLPPSGGPVDYPMDFWKKRRRRFAGKGSRSDNEEKEKPRGKVEVVDVLALYGLKRQIDFDDLAVDDGACEVLDTSQEDSPPPKLALAPRDAPKGKGEGKAKLSQAWIDDCKSQMIVAFCVDPLARCCYRLLQGGERVNAAMSVGPRGFALAAFPGEEPMESELPNIILESPYRASAKSKGKSKAKAKGKAKGKAKAKTKSRPKASSSKAAASSDEEEEGEEEEGADDADESSIEHSPAPQRDEVEPEDLELWTPSRIEDLKQRASSHNGSLGKLKLTCGGNQTYFCSPSSSPALICTVSLKQSPNHLSICCGILEMVLKKNWSKGQALELRSKMLNV